MVLSIVLGLAAIRRRDIARHRAWMMRGYAIGQGAGTQVLIRLPWDLIFGPPSELSSALLMGAGWVDQPRRGRMDHPDEIATASTAPSSATRPGRNRLIIRCY